MIVPRFDLKTNTHVEGSPETTNANADTKFPKPLENIAPSHRGTDARIGNGARDVDSGELDVDDGR